MPGVRVAPAGFAWTDGPDAADLCSEYWFEPDPWQRGLLDDWLMRDAAGGLVVLTAGISCPRQNGKNGAIEALEFFLMLTDGSTHILHTAHQVKTAKKAFDRLRDAFVLNADDEIRGQVASVRSTNGQEGIHLTNGASIEYVARSRGSARGFDNITLVVWDEAQELQSAHVDALMYTLGASRGDRMLIYAGTPPEPGAVADVFRKRRDKFMRDASPRSCYHEWGIRDLPPRDSGFDDLVDLIYEVNPAMGTRLDLDWTHEEFDNSDGIDGFARERLGWWCSESEAVDHPILADDWAECRRDDSPDGPRSYAVRFSADDSFGVVAVCSAPEGERPHVEVIEAVSTSGGLSEIASRVARVVDGGSCVVVDGRGMAQAFEDQLAEAVGGRRGRRRIVRPSTADVTAAYSGFAAAVAGRELTHAGQPQLTASATQCARRRIGNAGGFGFESWGAGDAAYVEAAALAHWRACQTRRTHAGRRKARYG